tara:strand:- start:268 stop:510 length:243 start_codon:yes stop_codon:yes gene_type:complete
MQTKEQVEAAFKADLKALLEKYNAPDGTLADINLGEETHSWHTVYSIDVYIPAIYNKEFDCVRETAEFRLTKTDIESKDL